MTFPVLPPGISIGTSCAPSSTTWPPARTSGVTRSRCAGGDRHYVSLYRDEYVDVWLLCWTRGNDTGWHDHDISSGAVRVVQGTLHEYNPRIGGEHTRVVVPAGHSFSFGPDHIHRLTGDTDQAVSIHAYSPPLWRLGQYSIDDTGVMRRVSVSYADELAPAGRRPPLCQPAEPQPA